MRKSLFLMMVFALFMGQAIAAPVGEEHARLVGLKFMQSNSTRNVTHVELAYTQTTESGRAALYVFNAEGCFVVVSADDAAQPILAFSDEGAFDAANMPDGLAYYMRHYARQIEYAAANNMEADAETAAQWAHVVRDGFVSDPVRGRNDVQPLLTTNWNQDYPYNYFCPTGQGGPGGRAYAGCAAAAMSMVMKYWNWPEQGEGQYSYTPDGYSEQAVDFGATTYDWANMPNSIYSSSQSTQIQAVARLMYHCGVSIDMQYGPNGSGAYSNDVPRAISSHFRYTSHANRLERDMYSKYRWEEMLIANLEEGFPLYYSGVEGDFGHAFACCGYRASDRKFYFNWGWSGMGNGWFAIDALNSFNGNFNDSQAAIFDMIPNYIYDGLIPAAKNLTVEASDAHAKTGIVSWENPSENLGGETINNIDKVVLLRDGTEIFSQTNVTPGQVMTFEDHVDNYDCYHYTVYYISNETKGRFAKTSYQYGPTCTWKIIGQTTNFQGWNDGWIQILNSYGSVCEEMTMTSSTPVSKAVRVPEGNVTFKWIAPSTAVGSLTFNIKNSSNTSVYSFSGSSSSLPATLYTGSNDCDGCQPPTDLSGQSHWANGEFGTLLTWSYDTDPQSFKVYRSTDGVNYENIATVDKTEREYFDATDAGGYYYQVTAFRSYCESTPAWASDDEDFVHVEVTSVGENGEDGCQLYPNPANATLCVESDGLEQIAIFNVMGQVVYQQHCSEDGLVLSTSNLSSGVYTIRVKSAQGFITRRFSVMH